jgi:hypothetical protein
MTSTGLLTGCSMTMSGRDIVRWMAKGPEIAQLTKQANAQRGLIGLQC